MIAMPNSISGGSKPARSGSILGIVVPTNYRLNIATDISKLAFEGDEYIDVEIKEPTRSITLNAKKLKIKSASVISKGKEHRASVLYQKKLERIVLKLPTKVSGKASIHITYSGVNNDKMYGFYVSKYTSKSGKEAKMLTSQFEAVDARAAFPCIDEPASKATFEVSLTIDKDLDAVSNMPVKKILALGKKKSVVFERTPKMSPYLLYLGVGRFDRLSSSYRGIKISVLSTPGNLKYSKLPLYYAKKFLQFYEEYFGIKYPLPKMDLIAIPDFAAGAMENWGAVTFREIALLCDESSPLKVKQNVAITIAHEFAHQWFGDLATMEWWNDLWLNESFATLMSYKAVSAVFPEWDIEKKFLIDTFKSAFASDQLASTHPVSVEVRSPGEIDEIFDNISYEKGGSVLKMLEDYVGPASFRKGVSSYLKKHAYSNGKGEDLWKALSEASSGRDMKVEDVAKDWLTKSGFPFIKVKKTADGFDLLQSVYRLDQSKSKQLWHIPIHYKTSDGKEGKILMSGKSAHISSNAEWIKLNYKQQGLYRVMYSGDILEKLCYACSQKKLDEVEAWGIEEDMFSFARSGRIKLSEYASIIGRHMLGIDYPLNLSLMSNLEWVFSISYGLDYGDVVRNIKFRVAKAVLDKCGFERKEGEPAITPLLRSAAISNLGIAGYEPVVKRCRALFQSKALQDEMSDIRSAVYEVVLWNGGSAEYVKL
ncbi:MAG: M1 family metallopeptidase, partial [Candidatus Micrarchaeaceae archaeon]